MLPGSRELRRARHLGRERLRLRVQLLQLLHVGLELDHHRLGIGRLRVLEQPLQPAGAVALAFPAQDRLADPRPPRLHLPRDRGREVGEEVAELVAIGLQRRLLREPSPSWSGGAPASRGP